MNALIAWMLLFAVTVSGGVAGAQQTAPAKSWTHGPYDKNIPRKLTTVTNQAPIRSGFRASYSTEATIAPMKSKGRCEVVVRVSQLVERDGKLTEELISQPKIRTGFGVPASLYSGLQPAQPNYQNEDNVSVDVSWPEAGKNGLAYCTVMIKRGDIVVSKSKLQVRVEDE